MTARLTGGEKGNGWLDIAGEYMMAAERAFKAGDKEAAVELLGQSAMMLKIARNLETAEKYLGPSPHVPAPEDRG